MPGRNPTVIGRVRHVLGATVTVELDDELAGVTPIWESRLVRLGQIGALVRIPQGPVSLIASVTLVGIAELSAPTLPAIVPQQGNRWLQVQLVGEIDGLGEFHRGVSLYPGLDDAVHFTTVTDLVGIYPPGGAGRIAIGQVSAESSVDVSLDVAALVTRHSAIVGATGSGKTSAVASVLQSVVKGGFSAANIIVVDPHGEYAAALGTSASIRSVLGTGDQALRVPFWALPAADLLRILCGSPSETATRKFVELVAEERRRFGKDSAWLDFSDAEITADTPIPYDLRAVWFAMDFDNRATVETKPDGPPCVVDEGDAQKLVGASFVPYALGSGSPFKGLKYGHYSPTVDRLRNRLQDSRFDFLLGADINTATDPFITDVTAWLGGERTISVLDFSGVDSDVADVAIGVVLSTLLELCVRSGTGDGIGRNRPLLIVLEEAHRYLMESRTTGLARDAANRIAREGRKYGIGLCLVSQRPSELPDTALSQCGTLISLRLTNSTDQSTVRAALPDSIAGLSTALSALRTGEALISGEAIVLPTRTRLTRPQPEPSASDPVLDGWRTASSPPAVAAAIAAWRASSTGGI